MNILNKARELIRRIIEGIYCALGLGMPVHYVNSGEALPTDLRTAVWLHYVEGYGTDEIAEIVSCRPATVRTRLHRARKKLQTELKGELNDEHVGRNEEYQGAGRAEGADSRGGA